jgi:hypothetical protein
VCILLSGCLRQLLLLLLLLLLPLGLSPQMQCS